MLGCVNFGGTFGNQNVTVVNPDATLSARSGELTEGIVGGAHVDFASLPSKHVPSETCTFASVTAPARLERHINHH